MLHINKFQKLHLIPPALQDLRPECIRDKRRHPLFDQSILEQGRKQFIFHLPIQLMLAAGNRQNHPCPPSDRLVQGVVRGCVAGVEGHYHVHLLQSLVMGNIPHIKFQALAAIFFCQPIALLNYIFFQIQANNAHLISL